MGKVFKPSFNYKLVYVFTIRDDLHKGLLKIGDASINYDKPISELKPGCDILNKAANQRIKEYTNTAAVEYLLLYTELAIYEKNSKNGTKNLNAFRDYEVHKILENSGYNHIVFKDSTGKEWYKIDLPTVVKAITAVKNNQINLSNTKTKSFIPIIFRPEQEKAISDTLNQYKSGNEMLWNAKMRFGKTLCALRVVQKASYKKTIIITHRPVVDNGWYEDFNKIFGDTTEYTYTSKNHGNGVKSLLKSNKSFIYFASMQDLRGSENVGGKYEKNRP